MELSEIKTNEDVYEFISDSSIFGNLGLFIGAGSTMAILNEDYDIALPWDKLIEKTSESIGVTFSKLKVKGKSLPEIATLICKEHSRIHKMDYNESIREFKHVIANNTCWYPENGKRNEFAKYFNDINPKWIMTTNYDTVIESVLTGKGYPIRPNDYMVARNGLIPVYHLHGIRTNPDSIIITQEDYVSLFRPNQYRQQKLAQLIKESVTVLIGYNLGDFNVLTAVDWSNNVYVDEIANHPQGIIQFLHTSNPREKPYLSEDKKLIIYEFNNLSILLQSLTKTIKKRDAVHKRLMKELKDINEELISCDDDFVNEFIDNKEHRHELLKQITEDDYYTINGFLGLFTKSMDVLWQRTRPQNAFDAYSQYLTVLMDIITTIEFNKMQPALFESVVFHLDSISNYIGLEIGKSVSAYNTWTRRKSHIPADTYVEIYNFAKSRHYRKVLLLLDMK